MVKQDYFAEIAMTKHPLSDENKEVFPLPRPEIYFELSQKKLPYENKIALEEGSYEVRLQQFKDDLNKLRKQYKPFLSNYLPKLEEKNKMLIENFEFRYLQQKEIFSQINDLEINWEDVTIPHYGGPSGVDGKWRAYYRTKFRAEDIENNKDKRAIIHFQSVDYEAFVYVNGNYIGHHEGFFAPFEFDITDYMQQENELIIEVHNDIPMLGEGPILDGDKIYAATGPGWDDPETGWHHCPAGAGIFGKVVFEYRPAAYINDIFARPNIDEDYVELRIGIYNYQDQVKEDYQCEIEIYSKNFQSDKIFKFQKDIKYIGLGQNEYRYRLEMKDYLLWELEAPYLYGALVKVFQNKSLISERIRAFGMRKFISDETTVPKGKFYFNNRPIVLRGANEMGHLQQCVMKNDFEQLIDDILIAKLCNLNYYRITQRPVQEEIYDYFDMLGMMNQCDMPLFSFMRRNQVCEAIRQAEEMEHLIRSHPSTIMVSFINEPVSIRRTLDPNGKFSKRYEVKGHRHLLRDELEAFFVAARKVIYIKNPDRVIKNVEGDYDPPTSEGMPDFHCYTMWYSNHAQPIGKLYKGYLPPVKSGWMIGCGEYGAEGLDNYNVMMENYPKEWLATDEKGNWFPDKIVRAQTNSLHGDWYEEQTTMKNWIYESQKHQANATAMMTDAFRRRADYINHIAIHLLIDAWPSGWMKTLVGVDRIPKPAYFAYTDSLVPFRVNLRCDRRYVYGGETVDVEAWLLNDLPKVQEVKIVASISIDGEVKSSYEITSKIDQVTSKCVGIVPATIPEVTKESVIHLNACVMGMNGDPLNTEKMEFVAYPPIETMVKENWKVACFGDNAKELAKEYKIKPVKDPLVANTVIVSDIENINTLELETYLETGVNVVLILPDEEEVEIEIGHLNIRNKSCPEVFFAATDHRTKGFHFNMLYNKNNDYIDFIGKQSIECNEDGKDLVYSYSKKGFDSTVGGKSHLPFVKQVKVGKGTLTIVSLLLKGRTTYNANLDHFLISCIQNDF